MINPKSKIQNMNQDFGLPGADWNLALVFSTEGRFYG